MDIGTAIYNLGLIFSLIAIVTLIVVLSMNVNGPFKTFLRIISCPCIIFLGTYIMGLSTAGQFKYIGILIIVIGVFILIETGREFWVNRSSKNRG